MVLNKNYIIEEILKNNVKITGILHIGANECQELNFYTNDLHINPKNIIWIEAIPTLVEKMKNEKHIENIYQAVITNNDDNEVIFNVSNNLQSSSILELGTHAIEHPDIVYTHKLLLKTITIKSFYERNNIKNPEKYNFWNLDIQGAELMALKGGEVFIKNNVKIINIEVNTKKLYKNCPLIGDIDIFLKKYKFERVLTKITKHGWGDALYIKNTTSIPLIKYKSMKHKNIKHKSIKNMKHKSIKNMKHKSMKHKSMKHKI